jgi:predicted membrane protein
MTTIYCRRTCWSILENEDEMNNIFRTIKRLWLLFAHMLGKVNTILLLFLVYFVVIGIMSIIVRLFRKDLLQKKMDYDQASYWQTRVTSEQTLDRSKFQF